MKRWIVLENGSLFVYRSRLGEWGEGEGGELRKSRLLACYYVEEVKENEEEWEGEGGVRGREGVIALKTGGRHNNLLFLRAPSEGEKEEWVEKIVHSIDVRNGLYIKG